MAMSDSEEEPEESAEGLRPYAFQVGGHSCILARDGAVWKPLQATELAMYMRFQRSADADSGDDVGRALRGLVPEFFGCRRLRLADVVAAAARSIAAGAQQPPRFSKQAPSDASCLAAKLSVAAAAAAAVASTQSPSPLPSPSPTSVETVDFLVIRDLTSGYIHPSSMDIKLGVRQYGDDAPPNKGMPSFFPPFLPPSLTAHHKSDQPHRRKVASHARKCAESTSAELGARLCGSMVWQPREGRHRFVDKYVWRAGKGRDVLRCGIHDFFDNGVRVRTEVARAYIPRLRRLLAVVENPRLFPFRMYSASLLLTYDGGCEDAALVDMRLIDFAHTYPLEPGRVSDDGVALGVRNLLAVLEEMTAAETTSNGCCDVDEENPESTSSATIAGPASPPFC